ncbi:hypothetical protein PINS_up017235 [Pythium insidiosum]|nr:hypothetical protein PINS_up017235 [Pythium insidiosum]
MAKPKPKPQATNAQRCDALKVVIDGSSVADVAVLYGVHRSTIHRCNKRREDVQDAAKKNKKSKSIAKTTRGRKSPRLDLGEK